MLSRFSCQTLLMTFAVGLLLAHFDVLRAEDVGLPERPVIHLGKFVPIETGSEGIVVGLYEGQFMTLQLDKQIRSVSGFDTSLLNVNSAETKTVLFQAGPQSGQTTLHIRDDNDKLTEVAVIIKSRGIEKLETTLKKLFPKTEFQLHEVGDSILIRGTVPTDRDSMQITQVAQQYYSDPLNHLTVQADTAKHKPVQIPKGDVPLFSDKDAPDVADGGEQADLRTDIRALHADVKRLIELLEQRQSSTKTDSRPTAKTRAAPIQAAPAKAGAKTRGPAKFPRGGSIMYFYADWAPQSRKLMSLLDRIGKEESVSTINIDVQGQRSAAKYYGVTAVPTLMFVHNQKEVDRIVDLSSNDVIRQFVRQVNQPAYDDVWNALGLRLEPPPASIQSKLHQLQQHRYDGGMLVTEVSDDSVHGGQSGLQKGDVLVALGISATTNIQSVILALAQDSRADDSGRSWIKFHAVRDGETLQGELPIAMIKKSEEQSADDADDKLGRSDEAEAGTVLLFFQANWCIPCQQMVPVIRQIDEEGIVRVRTVDVDKERALAEKYDISSIPTMVLLRDGKEAHRWTGTVTAEQVREFILGDAKSAFKFYVGFTR